MAKKQKPVSFEDRFNTIVKKAEIPPKRHLWINALIVSIVIFVIIFSYIIIRRDFSPFRAINSTTAWVATIMIGFSMLLSAVCYFWDFFDTKIIYRKYFGVVGFGYVASHAIISLFLMPELFPFPAYYFASTNVLPFIFALLSTIYFGFMTLISNKDAIDKLGSKRWRFYLRAGYIAYIFAILHFGMKGMSGWIRWLQGGMTFPPPIGLILFIFALFVPYFRAILAGALMRKHSGE